MHWLWVGAGIAVVLLIVWWRTHRRWIGPWHELEELVRAITTSEQPRKFLITANPRANNIGLGLERFTAKQRTLEQSAQEGAHSLQGILGALPDGIALLDQRRRIQVMNPKFRELFGVVDDAIGVSLLEIVRDGAVDGAVAAAMESGEMKRETIALSRGLETRRDLEIIAAPFLAGTNGEKGAMILFRDITQMRQVEEMRKDFVANVSHELRTPLSIFRGYLETLLDDPKQSPDELVRILEVMDRHAERLTLLVEDILSLAQLESSGARLEFTEIYLPDFLGAILRDWERRFSAKLLSASLDVPTDLPVISADENRLQEVVYNLLDNAVKYSQPEGKIALGARRVNDRVRISVADKGIGIPARDLPRVFERFYRADRARSRQMGGTGLGLSIVKHIAQLHGGNVEATSEPGQGTTISVVLPIQFAASDSLPQQPPLFQYEDEAAG